MSRYVNASLTDSLTHLLTVSEFMMSFVLVAALSWASLSWFLPVALKVAIGLGAVIFVHELGHFLVAKACGVKCEKFMIGFDIGGIKIARRWGETLYGIGILPLGGYVKMLGQDDDPAHIAEQMKKSQVNEQSGDAVPVKGPNGETYYVDRRSYLAKSVPQHMAIISAGVIMNIIFAFIFAVIAYGMGVPYVTAIVSETIPGSPAWQAQLRPGDEIIKIADQENPTFMQLMGGVTLGDQENGIPTVIRRADTGEIETITLTPKRQPNGLAMIGVSSPQSLVLSSRQATLDHSPAAEAKLLSPSTGELKVGEPKLQGGDKIVRVGDESVADYRGFAAIVAEQSDKALEITIERPLKPRATVTNADSQEKPESIELKFEVAPHAMRDFGLAMKPGPITAIQTGSPADAAGLKVGDVIATVDGKPAGEAGGWTPDSLPDVMRRAAVEKREVEIVVERGAAPERVTVKVTPRATDDVLFWDPAGGAAGRRSLGDCLFRDE